MFGALRLRVVAGIAVACTGAACGGGDGDGGALDAPGHVVVGDMPYRVDIDAQPITALWAVEVSNRDDQWCASSLVFNSKPIGHSGPRCAELAASGATPAIELGRDRDKRFFVIFAEGLTQTGIDPGTAELDRPPTEPGVINADQNGPVILVVSEGARPGQGIVVEDDDGHQIVIPLPG